MGVDLGTKRIGIAVSDPDGLFASPLLVIQRRGGAADLREIAALVQDYEVGTVVVGLPVDLRGQAGVAAQKMAGELRRLRELLAVPVVERDERLTSAAANKSMLAGGLRREERKERVDKVAAAMLLQSHLDQIRLAHDADEN